VSPLAALAALATRLVHGLGVAGVFVAMTLESVGVPIPSEVVMPLGALASPGGSGLLVVVAAGTAGNLVGSWLAYGIGAAIGVEWRGARWLNRSHWEAAHRWFQRRGSRAVFVGRLVPVVRTYISFPAGAAAMPLGRFTLYTAAGSALWSAALAVAGRALGSRWPRLISLVNGYTVVALCAAAAVLLALWLRRRH
jgi:membrane protein DedA with SNARE-associated domain